jgi:VCBS repeat-containing protein
VQVADGNGGTDTQAIAVTITNGNEPPVMTAGGPTVTYVENGTPQVIDPLGTVTDVDSADFDGGVLTVTVSANATADDRLTIGSFGTGPGQVSVSGGSVLYEGVVVGVFSGGSGAVPLVITFDADATAAAVQEVRASVQFATLGDAPSTASREVTFTLTDGDGAAATPLVRLVHVQAVNDDPVIISDGGGASVAIAIPENTTAVTTVTSTDVDGGAPTYSIVGGADAALFTINATTGELNFTAAPNHESPSDAGANNIYDVTVQVDDGNGGTDTQAIVVAVTNANEAPDITSNGGGATAAVSVSENQTAVTTVTSSDVDGAAPIYSIVGGADAALFTINAATGALTFVTAPDFESPADAGGNNVYDVTVQVSDGNGGTDTQAIAVTVTNVNEAPVITSNGSGATASISVAENQTTVTTVTSTDVDGGAPTYSIVGGADAALFTINATTGALTFVAAPDFENPADADGDNAYQLTVQASDGNGGTSSQNLTVTVTNVNEAPVVTSAANVSVVENQSAVTTVTSTDVDGGAPIYSIAGGSDAALFSIDPVSGALRFVGSKDFEAPADLDRDNVYEVTVQVSDGNGGSALQAIAVTVSDVNEAPVIDSTATVAVGENQTAVMTVTSVDPEGDAPTYAIIGGADAALFAIDAVTGALTFVAASDFEAPADFDGDNVYEVTVQVADGNGGVAMQAIAVTVTNVNEAPVITSGAAVSVTENGTAVSTLTSTDADGGAPSYSIVGGADAALFSLDATSGALRFDAAPDYEAPADADTDNIYQLVVNVADGNGGSAQQSLAVAVIGVNEAPAGVTPTLASVLENAPAGTLVAMVTASDPDAGEILRFSLVTDGQGRFVVDTASGALQVAAGARLDFESAPTHTLVLRVTDAQGLQTEQTIVVALRDVAEAPPVVTPPDVGPALGASLPPPSTGSGGPEAAPAPVAVPTVTPDRETATNRAPAAPVAARGVGTVEEATADARPSDNAALNPRGGAREPAAALVASVGFVFDGVALGDIDALSLQALLGQTQDEGVRSRFAWNGLRLTPELDANDMARAGDGDPAQAITAALQDPVRVASASLTAGFVWWLTRSGGLITSILMGIPAWRHVDLLPVLASREDDDNDDDEEPIDAGLHEPLDSESAHLESGQDSMIDRLFSQASRSFGESKFL